MSNNDFAFIYRCGITKPMRIIFFGNTKYSAIGARIIHEQLSLSHVVTIPDRLDKKDLYIPGPVKAFAIEKQIPVMEVEKLTQEKIDYIAGLQPDFLVVEDYGLILPKRLLELPKYAPLNVHHSLLPKYRGPSPAPTAILYGEKVSGVSIIHMNEKVDAGDVYAQQPYTLKPTETTDSLLTELNKLGGELAVSVIKEICTNEAKPRKQEENEASLTYYMKKTDGFFTVDNPPSPEQLDRMIRAYYPWPGVWTRIEINGQTKIVKFLPNKQIQVEGKNPMGIDDFYNGYPELKQQIEKLLR